MKRTKSFFIALLGFSLMGSYVMAQTYSKDDADFMVSPFYYTIWDDSEVYIVCPSLTIRELKSTTNLVVPSTVTNPADGVTYTVTGILDGACKKFTAVTNLTLPSTLKEISSSAFEDLPALKEVDLQGAKTTIGGRAFSGCSELNEVQGMENVSSIGAYAFSTTALQTLELPSSLESLGNNAFQYCTSLKSLELNTTLTSDNIFLGCSSLANVTFGESVTNIPDGLLAGTAVSSVAFPEGLTSIGATAFEDTRLEEVEIPASVTSIGASAFYGCPLKTANFVSNPEIGSSAFPIATKRILTIDDAKAKERAFDDTKSNTFTTIIYTNRTFTSEKYASLMLPFVPAAEVLDQFEIYELGEMEDDCLYFNQVTTFVAGTPYLVKVKEGNDAVNELSAEDAVIANGGKHMSKKNSAGWQMKGVYDRVVLDGANSEAAGKRYYYYTSAQNAFLYSQGTLGVNPYRMYVEAPVTSSAKVRMMTRGLDGETTAIEMEEIEDLLAPAIDAYYDLNGCRVLNPVEGNMYIVNGKKIVF